MSRAVQFDGYGDIDVLEVRDVPRPVPGQGEVLVAVKAAGINPGEAMIRKGALHDRWPATFPSGQGSDLAGVVAELGEGVTGFAVGDEVIGFSLSRSSQAEFVSVPADQLTLKPAGVPWDVAGALYVAGATAYAAVRALKLGGNDGWLRDHGVIPVNYGDGLAGRLRAASPSGHVDAFLDFFGGGYVAMALHELGVAPERIDTVIDFAAIEQFGVLGVGSADATNAGVVAELADLVARGGLEVPIAATFPLDDVQDAYRQLEDRHTRGKLVLRP